MGERTPKFDPKKLQAEWSGGRHVQPVEVEEADDRPKAEFPKFDPLAAVKAAPQRLKPVTKQTKSIGSQQV